MIGHPHSVSPLKCGSNLYAIRERLLRKLEEQESFFRNSNLGQCTARGSQLLDMVIRDEDSRGTFIRKRWPLLTAWYRERRTVVSRRTANRGLATLGSKTVESVFTFMANSLS